MADLIELITRMIRGHILYSMSGLDGGTSKPFSFSRR